MKRQPSPVRLHISKLAPAFGLTVAAVRDFQKRGAPGGDQIEVGEFAAFIARTTMGVRHAQAAA